MFTHNTISANNAYDLRIPFPIDGLRTKKNRTHSRWRLFKIWRVDENSAARTCRNGALIESSNRMPLPRLRETRLKHTKNVPVLSFAQRSYRAMDEALALGEDAVLA